MNSLHAEKIAAEKIALPQEFQRAILGLAMETNDAALKKAVTKLIEADFFSKVIGKWEQLQEENGGGSNDESPIAAQVEKVAVKRAMSEFSPWNKALGPNHYWYEHPRQVRKGLLMKKSDRYWKVPIIKCTGQFLKPEAPNYQMYRGTHEWTLVGEIIVDSQMMAVDNVKRIRDEPQACVVLKHTYYPY